MRTARNKIGRVYNHDSVRELKIGRGSIIRRGNDVCIIACGVMVSQALVAADELADSGIDAAVIDMHTLKPLDIELVDSMAKSCGCFVTAEDHSVIGGLGGALAEHLSTGITAPLEMVGVRDEFGESGESAELMLKMGLTSQDIKNSALKAISRKSG